MTELTERVARLEGAYEHLATKADIAELKAEIVHQINKVIVVQIGIIGIAVALLKYLPN